MVTLPASLWLTCHDTELWGHCWSVSQVPTPPAVLGERRPPSLGLYTCTLPSQSSILAASAALEAEAEAGHRCERRPGG